MKSRTRKYKGGQSSEQLISARSRLRSVDKRGLRRASPVTKRSSSYGLGSSSSRQNLGDKEDFSSSLSLESLASNISEDSTFKVGDKYFSLVENPETGKKDLFVWDSVNNTWRIDQGSSVSTQRSPLSSNTSDRGFFGGYKASKKNLKYLKNYKKGKSIGFTMRSSLKAKGLIPRSNGTYKVSKKYRG
jgi:hypothetical protein